MIPAIPSSLIHIVDEQIRFWLANEPAFACKEESGQRGQSSCRDQRSQPLKQARQLHAFVKFPFPTGSCTNLVPDF